MYKAGPIGFLIMALALASTSYRLFVHGEVTPVEKAACPRGKVIIGFDGKKAYCFTLQGITEAP